MQLGYVHVPLRVVVVKDDAGVGSDLELEHFRQTLERVNVFWERMRIHFTLDRLDVETRNSTLLRNDTTIGDEWANARERSRVAAAYPDHVVIYVRDIPPAPHAISANFSGSGDFVVLLGPRVHPGTMAHELGHMFNLQHAMIDVTLGPQEAALAPADQINLLRARFATAIRNHLNASPNGEDGLNAFDADRPRVKDTPPDAGPLIFKLLNGGDENGAIGTFPVPVVLGPHTIQYTLQPDRENVMSYFGQVRRFSPGQIRLVQAGLANGNRRRLTDTERNRGSAERQIGFEPALVCPQPGRLEVFARGAAGRIYTLARQADGGWPGAREWGDLGGEMASPPVVTLWGADRVTLFACGTDGHIYYKYRQDSRWWPGTTGWCDLGGDHVGKPAVVSWGPERVEVIARGKDGVVRNKIWEPSRWWPGDEGWSSLGGQASADPMAVSWGAGRVDVFIRTDAGVIRHKWWDGSQWRPSQTGWEDLGGNMLGQPVATSWGANRVDLFACGSDGRVYSKVWEPSRWWPSQTGWADGGSPTSEFPTVCPSPLLALGAVAIEPQRLDLFVRGVDGRLYNRVWEPSRWWPTQSNWNALAPAAWGGTDMQMGAPAVVATGPGELAVCARLVDGSIGYKRWSRVDGWSTVGGWEWLGLP